MAAGRRCRGASSRGSKAGVMTRKLHLVEGREGIKQASAGGAGGVFDRQADAPLRRHFGNRAHHGFPRLVAGKGRGAGRFVL